MLNLRVSGTPFHGFEILVGEMLVLPMLFSLFTNRYDVICGSANAWEEGDEIVLVSCRFDRIDLEAAISEVTFGGYSKPYP